MDKTATVRFVVVGVDWFYPKDIIGCVVTDVKVKDDVIVVVAERI